MPFRHSTHYTVRFFNQVGNPIGRVSGFASLAHARSALRTYLTSPAWDGAWAYGADIVRRDSLGRLAHLDSVRVHLVQAD